MGTHTGGIGRGSRRTTTGPGGRRAGREAPFHSALGAAGGFTSPEVPDDADHLTSLEAHGVGVEPAEPAGPRFKFRKTTGVDAPTPLPPLPPARPSELAAHGL